ncbi:hypothetical protein WOLCODRAFT_138386, partial [Wolfiporia cocos MD-104 SS10]
MAPRKKQKIAEDAPQTDRNVAKPKAPRTRAIRGRRGGLKSLPDMPLDILFEIFTCLGPKDLLYLTRTSKSLRQLLMTRETISVWKATRANIRELPECPSFLSEPAYANLAFSPHCHRCLKSNVRIVIWEFCARYCSECKLEMFCSWNVIERILDIEMSEALNIVRADIFQTHERGHHEVLHRPEYERMKQTWESLPNEEAKAQFQKEQKERVQQIKQFSRLCRRWENSLAGERSAELEEHRRTRLRQIVSRLEEMGWGEELDRMKDGRYAELARHTSVCVSRPLTERAWKKIRDDVVERMEELRERRIKKERRKTLATRLRLLSTALEEMLSDVRATAATQMEPFISDYAFMPEFRSIIESPDEREVTRETLDALRDLLPSLVVSWQADLKSRFVDLVKSKITAPEGVDVCNLAITCVECRACHMLLWFPGLLAHRCFRSIRMDSYGMDPNPDAYESIVASVMSDRRPQFTMLEVPDDTALDRSRNIVRLCKLDPATATTQDMDALDIRLSNVSNNETWDRTWRAAMHSGCTFPRPLGVEWSLVPQSRMDELRERERAYLKRRVIWCCALCSYSFHHGSRIWDYADIKTHMLLQHLIELPSEANDDIFMHADYHTLLGHEPITINPKFL